MTRTIRSLRLILFAASAALLAFSATSRGQNAAADILNAAQAGKLLPASVYFDGQSAPTQLRNSAGIRFSDGQLTLAVLVDSSGYSGAVAQRYQGYLLTGVALDFVGHRLPAGAYGIGVVEDQLYVMDLGNHDLFRTAVIRDAKMHRPVPLQIAAGAGADTYRLCLGRECLSFRRAR